MITKFGTRALFLTAGSAAVATLLAACGSGDSGGSTAASSSSGAPVKVMVINTEQSSAFGFPEQTAAVKARAAAQIAAGGAGGH